MIKKYCLFLFLFFVSIAQAADDIAGFWQTLNKDNKPSSVIAVYLYEGKYYGRIIGTYNKQGELDDTIYHPKSRAPGIVGNPYYAGLDIVWDAHPGNGNRFKGHVVDPRSGKIYNAELWKKKENLILRGELFIFGKNVTWPPFPESKFTADFKKPNTASFVPVIPKVAN